jgi:hypothetical protein
MKIGKQRFRMIMKLKQEERSRIAECSVAGRDRGNDIGCVEDKAELPPPCLALDIQWAGIF